MQPRRTGGDTHHGPQAGAMDGQPQVGAGLSSRQVDEEGTDGTVQRGASGTGRHNVACVFGLHYKYGEV